MNNSPIKKTDSDIKKLTIMCILNEQRVDKGGILEALNIVFYNTNREQISEERFDGILEEIYKEGMLKTNIINRTKFDVSDCKETVKSMPASLRHNYLKDHINNLLEDHKQARIAMEKILDRAEKLTQINSSFTQGEIKSEGIEDYSTQIEQINKLLPRHNIISLQSILKTDLYDPNIVDYLEADNAFGAINDHITMITEEMDNCDIQKDPAERTESLRDRAINTAENLKILQPKMVVFAATLNKFYLAGYLNQERQKKITNRVH